MGNVLSFDRTLTPDSLTRSALPILPARSDEAPDLAIEHDAQPLKSVEDIQRVSDWFISNERYRDNMLFIVGINFGLRCSDLSALRFSDLIDENFCFKQTFPVFERKTRNTRKVKKNRYITINEAVMDAVTLYLQHTENVHLDDYMFKATGNRGVNLGKPMARYSIFRIMREALDALAIDCRFGTHGFRKTFGYHQMLMSNNDPRKLLLLQKMFGHSSAAQTLTYIGITDEEIEDAYINLNLGHKNCYAKYGQLMEAV